MLGEMLSNIKIKTPLIHNITNYVTVNDCANILLACGASPIMSDDVNEVAEITSICNGLVINIGTLNQHTIEAMFLAGHQANTLNHPIILDPVGAGASALRTNTALNLVQSLRFAVIRGNMSEIKTLIKGRGKTKGVDVDVADQVTSDNLNQAISLAKNFAKQTNAVIAITGKIDIVADAQTAYCIYNGHPDMSKITGTGCQLSALTAAYVTANPDNILEATVAATCAMGLCGEIARKRMSAIDGNSSYRNYIIDAIYHLTPEELERGARYEMQ